MDVSNSSTVKQPSESSASMAIKAFAATLLLSRAVSTLLAVCVVVIPILHFVVSESAASNIGHWAILAAVLFALVLMPAHAICKRVFLDRAVYVDYVEATGGNPYYSPLDPQVITTLKSEARFQQRVIESRCNCEAASWILAAVLAFLFQGALLNLIGSPWAYSLTLVFVPVVSLAASAILVNVAGRSYKRENPELYTEVIELFQSSGK